ncbi:MAG: serine/threonine-protein kinase [Myxococcota bacterium]
MHVDDLKPGRLVDGRIRLLDCLGHGGMGSVWTADHTRLQARVAVKFIDPALVREVPNLRTRFAREASIAARLRSIHAVQAFDHGETEGGTPYIVMELLEGETLTDRVERDGPLSLPQAAHVVAQVAKVLHRAHGLSVVHRDIKPDNLFLLRDPDYDLFVKVLDFGIAKVRAPGVELGVTERGYVVGTPEFMSPEQWVGRDDLDHRSDLYSLGMVTFYALTGELPFREDDASRPIWVQQAEGDLRPLGQFLDGVPPTLDGWMRRALAAKPDQRFRDAKQMARALILCVNGEGYDVVDELSVSETSGAGGRRSGGSEVARHDLFDDTDEPSTTVMDEAALRAADALDASSPGAPSPGPSLNPTLGADEEPPTQRRPRPPELALAAGTHDPTTLVPEARSPALLLYGAVVAFLIGLAAVFMVFADQLSF